MVEHSASDRIDELVDLGYLTNTLRQKNTFPPSTLAPWDDNLAFEAYNRVQISLVKLAELLDVPIEETKAQLKKRNAPLDLGVSSEDELLRDLDNA